VGAIFDFSEETYEGIILYATIKFKKFY